MHIHLHSRLSTHSSDPNRSSKSTIQTTNQLANRPAPSCPKNNLAATTLSSSFLPTLRRRPQHRPPSRRSVLLLRHPPRQPTCPPPLRLSAIWAWPIVTAALFTPAASLRWRLLRSSAAHVLCAAAAADGVHDNAGARGRCGWVLCRAFERVGLLLLFRYVVVVRPFLFLGEKKKVQK